VKDKSSTCILIVEDDQEIRETLTDILEMEGYQTNYAVNGKDGLSKVQAVKPNLIFLDLNMPVMDGMEFLKQRENDAVLKNIPVIVMTATGDARRAEAEKYANSVIKKPMDLNVVLNSVEKYV
jgi:CheY-like chemotaxis protein